jgi:hypothetical protein
MRPRQVRYQAALRPDICWSIHSKPLPKFPPTSSLRPPAKLYQNCIKTPQFGLPVSKRFSSSFACRFIFSRASRFICNFICEYFLNTFASPCRSSWVTRSCSRMRSSRVTRRLDGRTISLDSYTTDSTSTYWQTSNHSSRRSRARFSLTNSRFYSLKGSWVPGTCWPRLRFQRSSVSVPAGVGMRASCSRVILSVSTWATSVPVSIFFLLFLCFGLFKCSGEFVDAVGFEPEAAFAQQPSHGRILHFRDRAERVPEPVRYLFHPSHASGK